MGLFDGWTADDAKRDTPDDATLQKRLEWGIKKAKEKKPREIGDEMFAEEDKKAKKKGSLGW